MEDLGHRKGNHWDDGLFDRARNNADHECWQAFWHDVPDEYKEAYAIGYKLKEGRRAKLRLFTILTIELPLSIYCAYKIVEGIHYPGIQLVIGSVIALILFFTVVKLLISPIFFIEMLLEKTNWFKRKIKVSEHELFRDYIDKEYKKFFDAHKDELIIKNLKGEVIGYVGGVAIGLGLIAGHLGGVLLACKIASGNGLNPFSMAMAAAGTGLDAADSFDADISMDSSDVVGISDSSLIDNTDGDIMSNTVDSVNNYGNNDNVISMNNTTSTIAYDSNSTTPISDMFSQAINGTAPQSGDASGSIPQSQGVDNTFTLTDPSNTPVSTVSFNSDDDATAFWSGLSYAGSVLSDGSVLSALNLPSGRVDGNSIYDNLNQLVYTIEGNTIYDTNHQVAFMIHDGEILDKMNQVIGRIS